jgi:hypothetical protein
VQFHKANLLSTESRFCEKVLATEFYRNCSQLFAEGEMEEVFDLEFMLGLTDDLLNYHSVSRENQPINRYDSLELRQRIRDDEAGLTKSFVPSSGFPFSNW